MPRRKPAEDEDTQEARSLIRGMIDRVELRVDAGDETTLEQPAEPPIKTKTAVGAALNPGSGSTKRPTVDHVPTDVTIGPDLH